MEFFKSLYEPLKGPHAFRLLDLLPGQGEEQICCELSPSNLALRPEYYALSYTWGSEESPVLISVNGTPHWIHNNLHSFLFQLRLKNSRRTLWVDSLCINQMDNADKCTSIPLMKEIYTAAQSVLVWLGAHADGSAELFDFFYLTIAAGAPSQVEDTQKSGSDSLTPHQGLAVFTEALLHPLKSLQHRPYWTRTWIIQEIVLARNIRIFCGDSSIPWTDFAPIVQQLYRAPSSFSSPSPFESICELQKVGANLTFEDASLMEYRVQTPDGPGIRMTHHSQCKDRRDLMYGVLGLIKDADPSPAIDYTCSIEELVYSILACYRGGVPLRYCRKLTARLRVDSLQCFTYAKRVVGRKLAGDVDTLLALREFGSRNDSKFTITHVDEQTTDKIYIVSDREMKLIQVWEEKNGLYRLYFVETSRIGRSSTRVYDSSRYIWTKARVRPGDFCLWGVDYSFDGRWTPLVFERGPRGPEVDLTVLGFGIEMFQNLYAAEFVQAGGGMATFFEDDYPYFERQRMDSSIQKQWGKNDAKSSYNGSEESFSIFELLKLASFADVFNAVDRYAARVPESAFPGSPREHRSSSPNRSPQLYLSPTRYIMAHNPWNSYKRRLYICE